MSLKQYLSKSTTLKIRDRILLLTQLLEAVTHMSNQNIAHRYKHILNIHIIFLNHSNLFLGI